MSNTDHETNLIDILQRYWGYDSFRSLQPEAMACVMSGRDSVVVLPTGGGKSLCFQAPAMAMPGMAVVISPLISLMKDQVDALEANGVPAACINSAMTGAERRAVDAAIRERALKLLYVSPERAVMPPFIEYLSRAEPSFLVVDEAHCISQWGHDFRPEYRGLHVLREAMPSLAVHAYTATATPQVRDDIVRELRLRDPALIVGSFDRPNLVYRVFRRSHDALGQLRQIIDRHPGDAGIIYCIRRRDVDDLCEKLAELGHNALPYHAGMGDEDRRRNQEAFRRDEADVVVATVAFGMGIDKPNIRYVVHAGMPKTVEHYQQETGRAGRDGLESECVLFYGSGDYGLWKGILDNGTGDGGEIALSKLNDMYQFCTRHACRHATLLSYFGQLYPNSSCEACDVCLEETEVADDSAHLAVCVLKAVVGIGEYAGPKYTTEVLAGEREERILRKGHDKLEAFGALRVHAARQIREWIEELTTQGYLEKRGEYNLLAVTPRGGAVLEGSEIPRLSRSSESATSRPARVRKPRTVTGADEVALSAIDRGLLDVLKVHRRQHAQDLGMPPYVVFGDATLREMACRRPLTIAQFRGVYGVGQQKCERWGEEFLRVIADYCEANGLSSACDETSISSSSGNTDREDRSSRPKAARMPKADRQCILDALFDAGRSAAEIAEEQQLSLIAVGGYLETYLAARGRTEPAPWSSEAVLERVREVAAIHGTQRLRPIYEALEGDIDYVELRVCLACIRNGA